MQSATPTGRVSWFDPAKRFGFIKLDERRGDAFLHFDVLKAGGYYFVPRGTTVQVRIEPDERGAQRVVEVLHVDTSTAAEGEPPPLLRKKRAARREQQELEVEESQARLRTSIAETERLVDESDHMLKRHRQERETDDAEEEGWTAKKH
jgi:cold shock CspA family protein